MGCDRRDLRRRARARAARPGAPRQRRRGRRHLGAAGGRGALRASRAPSATPTGSPSCSCGTPARRCMKTFLFTDIVGSTELASAVGSDRHWVNLLRRHDDALRAIFADFRGQVVDHTGDGFFAAFEEAADALRRRRRDPAGDRPGVRVRHPHRRPQPTAPCRRGSNYHGKGVHAAARIGAAARGREILASRATLAGLPRRQRHERPPADPEGLQGPRRGLLGGVGTPAEGARRDGRSSRRSSLAACGRRRPGTRSPR